jgi:elongation factor 1-gamma
LSKFPLGKVPAFESSNGDAIFESNAIALYVGNEQLNGKTQSDAAKVQQWVNFGDNEILPASCTWVFPCLGITQFNKQETENAKTQMKKVLTVLDNYLKTKTYLVGERISQADIALCCDLLLAYQYVLEPAFRSPYVNVNRWFSTLINQPNFKKVIGDFKLCEKMAVFDGKKYAELHGGDKKKKEKENKQAQQKKEEPKKKETPQKKQDEDDEDKPPKEEKSKDPFAKFPKSDFDMDAFKRCYSNNDIQTVALPYFWEKFDKENYSIWFCKYIDVDYLKTQLVFMTVNLVNGMFQRIEKMRKNAFGSMCVFGENRNCQIGGVWFWKGHELAFELCDDWKTDYESYEWTKLDPDNEEHRTMVNEYFAQEGKFTEMGGLEMNEGVIYK